MNNNLFEKITKLSFFSMALLPLLKPNYNSITIILYSLFTVYWVLKTKKRKYVDLKYFFLIIPFFMFLIFELTSKNFNSATVLLSLPFLIFPLIFLFRPKFIEKEQFNKSFLIFQFSTILQSLIYLIVFLKENSFATIFKISNENIPFFREYVNNNYLVEMHPTYFSSFLLLSITISLFNFFKFKFFHTINIFLSLIFLFLFSSRIVILIFLLTIVAFIIYTLIKGSKKRAIIISLLGSLLLFSFFSTRVVKERFYELITEINKPIVGDYYNSTNTRVAIYKCDFKLLKEVPFLGFGNNLQTKLDECYKNNNDSNFYKINVFNTHNYYFYLLLYGGWIFFILFVIYIILSYNFLKHTTLFVFVFSQFLIINLTENYLSRHYGVILFSYFSALFIFYRKNEKSTTT